MTPPRAVADGGADASHRPVAVIDIAANTVGHIAYLERLRASMPIVPGGDTLAALRTWKNAFR